MTTSSDQGIYYHPESHKILAVGPDSTGPGEPWARFTDDYTLGLLAARRELEALGIVDNGGRVEWHELASHDVEQRRRVSSMIRELTGDSDSSQREAEGNRGFWQRLVSAFKSPIASGGEGA
jgi:hypothetical protein